MQFSATWGAQTWTNLRLCCQGVGDQPISSEQIDRTWAAGIGERSYLGIFTGKSINHERPPFSFLAEKESATPNYPLIRKYFKKGNENLKKLLIYGLEKKPTDVGLLNDLGFFHEFKNMLSELIQLYLRACEEEQDMNNFKEIVLNFHYDTEPDGFDALYELEQQIDTVSDKGKILRKIRQEQELEPESIEF